MTDTTARRPKPAAPEPPAVPDATDAWLAHSAAGGRALNEWALMRAVEAAVRGSGAVGSVEGWVSRPGGWVELVRAGRRVGGGVSVWAVVGRARAVGSVRPAKDAGEGGP